ncbi:N-acetyl-D-glucosamine kinase-like isoform X2 [Camellia sinensis]|uniref:N-acetyl-D-glucosamine kinase-like isoform X2 n=1 Tax=Camellia sinensis TaxID=4442 RepID=UPI001036EE98|nr:N-acetyl-D-glucosamine kinase-like isoform X2 [Camellia sinensis]
MMKKRYRNGDIWDFEHEMAVAASREVVLGLDGGTTSTVCICMPLIPYTDLLPDPIPVLARSIAGCSNHNSVGETAVRETLEQVMADALSRSGSNRFAVRAVCLAVSGVNHPTDQQRILSWLREIFPSHVRLYVQNDAVAALASGTMGKLHGCVLIAGTGTIAYGFTEDGREARAAGAGPILGDWGRWTYADPSWARIAALVPVVVSCAEAGDQVANKILLDAVQELASSVKAVVQRLGLSGEDGKNSFPLVMVGGVLEANKRWDIGSGKEVINSIVNDFPGALPIRPRVEPAIGAALLAWNFLTRKSP